MEMLDDHEAMEKLDDFFINYNQVHDLSPETKVNLMNEEEGYIDMGYPDYTMSQPITAPLEYKYM